MITFDLFVEIEDEIWYAIVGGSTKRACDEFADKNGIHRERIFFNKGRLRMVRLNFISEEHKNKFVLQYL